MKPRHATRRARIRRAARRSAHARRGADDEGSVLLLTIGYAALALAVILVCTDATSLYLAQKHADAAADAAALAAADAFTLIVDADGHPTAQLTDDGVDLQATAFLADTVTTTSPVRLVSAGTPDGRSARVTVATVWHPPVVTVFVPDGITLHATATSRTALR